MQLAFLTDLFAEHAPAKPVKASTAKPAILPAYERYTIEADRNGVSIIAPAQQVATAPFQPIDERANLPGLFLRYRWHDIAHLFAAFDGCEDLPDHPAAPWIERIIRAVDKTEALVLTIEVRYDAWIRLSCRSLWTGLDRQALLRLAETASMDTPEQARARADAVARRLRSAGRFVVTRDTVPTGTVFYRNNGDLDSVQTVAPRVVAEPQQVRIGALVITIGAAHL